MKKILCTLMVTGLLTTGAWAAVIEDTFTLGDGRAEGDSLADVAVETGSGSWQVGTGGEALVFTADGTIALGDSPDGRNTGGVAITPPASGVISVKADILPTGGGNGDWGFVGFGPSAGDPNSGGTANVWVLLRNNGGLLLRQGDVTMGTGDAGGATWNGNVFHTLELVYDVANNTASVNVDGSEVIAATSYAGNVPTLSYAVFGLEDDLTTGEADNFAYVPEPMTLGVLGIGGLAMIRRRRTT